MDYMSIDFSVKTFVGWTTSSAETTVTNTSDKDEYVKEFEIKVIDVLGNEMITLKGFVGEVIKAKESRVINSYCGENLSTATNITYTVIK